MSNNQHVLPTGDKWSVRRVGATRASGVFKTQSEAIRAARDIAKNQGVDLFIHDRMGRISDREVHSRTSRSEK
jgi:thiamine monophosphate synthase